MTTTESLITSSAQSGTTLDFAAGTLPDTILEDLCTLADSVSGADYRDGSGYAEYAGRLFGVGPWSVRVAK